METTVEIWGGERVVVCAEDGPLLADERDINGFVGEALGHQAQWLALPVSRLGADFLKLRTRLAGETTQKFVNYRIGLAVIGDISPAVADSDALRDYVRESNRGQQVWFLPNLSALKAALDELRP